MSETNPLFSMIVDKIREEGPISVLDYMSLCLGHPEHGYYMKHDPFGVSGDFITAPEISQIFGEMIGVWVAETWRQIGKGPTRLIEFGPGRGTLMHDLLRATKSQPEFHESLTIHMIETSPVLANAQYMRLRDEHERIEWIDGLDEVPDGQTIMIANEFFDALPIRQHVSKSDGLRERRVGYNEDENALEWVLSEPGLSLVKSGQQIKEDTIIETSPAAKIVMQQVCERLKESEGAFLTIDYGFLGDAYQDTLQAAKNHQFHPVLKDPGEADLTAHVDFLSLQNIASEHGLYSPLLMTQREFLQAMGGDIRLKMLSNNVPPEQKDTLASGYKRLTDKTAMGELFKVMAVSSAAPVVGFDDVA